MNIALTIRTRIIENLPGALESAFPGRTVVYFLFIVSPRAEKEYFHLSPPLNPKREISDVLVSFSAIPAPTVFQAGRE